MTNRVTIAGLQIASELLDFINQEVLPGTKIDDDLFGTSLHAY